MSSPEAQTWLRELSEALAVPRLDQVERLRGRVPTSAALQGLPVKPVIARVAALVSRPVERDGDDTLGWWLDALLLQRVIVVPRSRDRALLPVLFVALTVLLGLIVGRLAAAAVMALGLVAWAVRAGGATRARHGAWLRLGDTIFDVRHVRVERLDDGWVSLEGRRVPAAVYDEAVRNTTDPGAGPRD